MSSPAAKKIPPTHVVVRELSHVAGFDSHGSDSHGKYCHPGPRDGCPRCYEYNTMWARETRRLVPVQSDGITRGEVDELGGVAVATRLAS